MQRLPIAGIALRQVVRPRVAARSENPGRTFFPRKIRPLSVLQGAFSLFRLSELRPIEHNATAVRAWVVKAARPRVCGKATLLRRNNSRPAHKAGRWARSAPARHGCSAAIGQVRPIECGSWLISIALASSRIQQRQSATSSSQAGRGNRHTPTGGTAITHPLCWLADRSRTQ